jgi:hypothetical protein
LSVRVCGGRPVGSKLLRNSVEYWVASSGSTTVSSDL